MQKALFSLILVSFLSSTISLPAARAQVVLPQMPAPGTMVDVTPAFTPAYLKGLVIHPEYPLQFDFLVHRGQGNLSDSQKNQEYSKLIKYFLTALTISEKDQWVNLSPYEKERIIPDTFGQTQMGQDLLAQDYMLKQLSASLLYPEGEAGKRFWSSIYASAKKHGGLNVPLNAFNKVWIVPDKAVLYEKGNTVYVLENHLKVMLEEDYLAKGKNKIKSSNTNSEIIKQIILPEIEKEINTGKNFAALRQVYSGMLLATWYKRALKESLLNKVYANQAKVQGVDANPENNQAIYAQYLQAFKKGAFNLIKDTDEMGVSGPRKYFAGGTKSYDPNKIIVLKKIDSAMAEGVNDEEENVDIAHVRLGSQTNGSVQSIYRFRDASPYKRIARKVGMVPRIKVSKGAEATGAVSEARLPDIVLEQSVPKKILQRSNQHAIRAKLRKIIQIREKISEGLDLYMSNTGDMGFVLGVNYEVEKNKGWIFQDEYRKMNGLAGWGLFSKMMYKNNLTNTLPGAQSIQLNPITESQMRIVLGAVKYKRYWDIIEPYLPNEDFDAELEIYQFLANDIGLTLGTYNEDYPAPSRVKQKTTYYLKDALNISKDELEAKMLTTLLNLEWFLQQDAAMSSRREFLSRVWLAVLAATGAINSTGNSEYRELVGNVGMTFRFIERNFRSPYPDPVVARASFLEKMAILHEKSVDIEVSLEKLSKIIKGKLFKETRQGAMEYLLETREMLLLREYRLLDNLLLSNPRQNAVLVRERAYEILNNVPMPAYIQEEYKALIKKTINDSAQASIENRFQRYADIGKLFEGNPEVLKKGWWVAFDLDRTKDIVGDERQIQMVRLLNKVLIDHVGQDVQFFSTWRVDIHFQKEEGFMYIPSSLKKGQLSALLDDIRLAFKTLSKGQTVTFAALPARQVGLIKANHKQLFNIVGPDKMDEIFFSTLRESKGKRDVARTDTYGDKTVFVPKGGIDMNPDGLELEIKRDQTIKMSQMNVSSIDLGQIQGFVPRILSIVPASETSVFSSLQ